MEWELSFQAHCGVPGGVGGNSCGLEGGKRGQSSWEVGTTVISYPGRGVGGGVSSGRTDKIKGVTGKEVEFKFGSFQRVTLSLPHTYFSLWLCLLILFTSAQVL